MSLFYSCTEDQMLKLEILDAHLHVMQSLATATNDNYPLHLDNRKLSLMLWSVSQQLTDTLDSIKANRNPAQDHPLADLKKAFAAYQAAEESSHV